MICFIEKITNKIYITQLLKKITNNKVDCPGTMNIYFIRDRRVQKRLSGIPWHYTRCWKLILYVPFVNYIKWQRKSKYTKHMGCFHPKQQSLKLYLLVMVCVNILGPLPFTIKTTSKAKSVPALTIKDPVMHHRLVWRHKWVSNIHPGFVS
jgi:hypothetical protein